MHDNPYTTKLFIAQRSKTNIMYYSVATIQLMANTINSNAYNNNLEFMIGIESRKLAVDS